jgi:hypothetical protein
MTHRAIATVAASLMVCFLLLSHFDGQFFLIHFYESLIYIAILLMLFYFEDRWAYSLGIVAPAGWLLLTFVTGGFGQFLHQLSPVAILGALASLLSIGMIAICAMHWKREFRGLGKGLSTFVISVVIVALYYGVMILWFWRAAAAPPHT